MWLTLYSTSRKGKLVILSSRSNSGDSLMNKDL